LVTSAPAFNMVSIWELEIFSNADAPASQIYVPRTGEYNLAARLSPMKSNGTLYLKVDKKLFSLSCPANLSTATWFELGSAQLNFGQHNVTVFASGNVTLDKIGIYSTSNNVPTINEVFNSDLSTPSVTYDEVNPCKYIAHIDCTRPFLLVFSESYHLLWKAFVDNKEISPIIVDSLVNGFFVNRTGNFDVVLYFTGQDFANIGLIISGGSIIILVIILFLLESTVGRRIKHILKYRRSLKRSQERMSD
jgi:hypothetical protein